MDENTSISPESYTPTSDNRHPDGLNLYTAEQAGELFSRTPTRIRQIATKFGIGGRFGKKFWSFTFEELILLEKHLRKEKRVKNVAPQAEESEASTDIQRMMDYLKTQLERLRSDGFHTLNDVWVGVNNRLTKEVSRIEHEIRDLRARLDDLEGKEWGRGVSNFDRWAPSTLYTHAAEAA